MLIKRLPSLFSITMAALSLLLLLCALPSSGGGAETKSWADGREQPWRIRFLEAAIVSGERVILSEVAVPLGDMPEQIWREMATRQLWPSPPEGKPLNMTRPRLQEAVMKTMRDLAPYCLFPGSMAVQRGGTLISKEQIHAFVERQLAPLLATLPGESSLRDFRLPGQIFMTHAGQRLTLEDPRRISPGRLSLRLEVVDLDDSVQQRLTGTVFVDCWLEVPCASTVLNRDDLLDHTRVTHRRMNLANLRSKPWDGLGGPWRVVRAIAPDNVIYRSDLSHIPTIRKGGVVTLLYEGKAVRLTVQAEAMNDGAAGESILVRNLQTKKEIYAVVRDSGTVFVATLP